MDDWRVNLLEEQEQIDRLVRDLRRVAVLGIRSERRRYRPAFYVAEYLASAGLDVVPVPVYENLPQILGRTVYHTLSEIPGDIDLVDVFRRAEDIEGHLEDMLAKHPAAVWFQSGIRNDRAAEVLARAGIQVVQDRCLMVEHRRAATR
jgi:predicted CoA-binding protein